MTGAPLTNGTAINVLLKAGVRVALGTDQMWETRDMGLLAGTALRNSEGLLDEDKALDLVSNNFYEFVGLEPPSAKCEFVIFEGSPLEIGGRLVAVSDTLGTQIWL